MSDETAPADGGRALGLNGTFTAPDGEVYSLSGLTYGVRNKFAQYLRAEAVRAVYELAKDGVVSDVDRVIANIANDWAAGHYRWGGRVSASSLGDAKNKAAFLFFQLQKDHPTVKLSQVEEWMQENEEFLYRVSMEAATADPTIASSNTSPASTLDSSK